jgi:hypothetical protein
MTSETRLDDLFSIWHERFVQGEDVPAVELCRDCPDLAPALECRITVQRRMETVLQGVMDPPGTAVEARGTTTRTDHATALVAPSEFVVPGYDVLTRLGEGGMGTVYRARDRRLKRLVALKVLRAGAASSPELRDRLRAEAEAIARLQHPHIVQIFEIGQWQPPGGEVALPFLALEYVPGGGLDAVLKPGPLEPAPAARLVEVLARAVHAAHQAGIVHRDLKPANVLLAPSVPGSSGSFAFGFPKVSDFGLSRLLDADRRQTISGMVMGTPAYMAPEQAEGRADIGPAADIWALGVILYQTLTGRVPFQGDSVLTTLDRVRKDAPRPPRELRGEVPASLEAICLKCLEKAPAARYATAAELADDLNRVLEGDPAPVATSLRKRFRHALGFGVLVLVLVLGLGGLAVLPAMMRGRPSGRVPDAGTAVKDSVLAPLEATLTVRHYRPSDGPARIWSLGEFGTQSVAARLGDVARVEARFSAPAYAYIVALDPDGSVQLCDPADPHTTPTLAPLRSYPPGAEDYFRFTDGKGLQAFVLIASRRPLPPFADWAAGRALSWTSLAASAAGAGAWLFDGRRWEPRTGPDHESRGQVVHLAGVPTPLAEACRRLIEVPGVDVVLATAFPVE